MAARPKGTWFAIGGATAAVAIGVLATVALGAPSLSAPAVTNVAPTLAWTEDQPDVVTSYDVDRADGACTGTSSFTTSHLGVSSPFVEPDGAVQGVYCYRVTGHGYAGGDLSDMKTVLVDTTAPAQPVFSPAITSPVHTPVTVAASATDSGGSNMQSLTLRNGATVLTAGVSSASLQWSAPDGTYTLTATAVDGAGNSTATPVSITVDNTAPAPPGLSFKDAVVAGSPTLVWQPNAGETYHVARTSPVLKSFALPVTPDWTDPDTLAPGTYTYVVTATDLAGNSTASAPASVVVTPPSVTAPRSISANSPTNTVPHLSWQPPVTFAVTSWRIWRDGALVATLPDAAAGSFDDTGLGVQGPHTYAVQAMSNTTPGDLSSSVSVTYDSVPPALDSATATPSADGTISIAWPPAADPSPGSGMSSYVVRRGSSAPADPSSGTAVCTLQAPATGCVDTTAKTGTIYGYSVFAIDGAGNVTRRETSAKAADTLAPDPVTGIRALASSPTAVRLTWDVPPLKGNNADLAGYRVLQLRPGQKVPLHPQDGAILCKDVDPDLATCDALKLTKGKKVTFAVFAFDGVPNYSPPAVFSFTPRKTDNKPPHKPTKVKLRHNGLRYLLTWVSPRDADLSKFRVTLYKKPPTRPSLGKAVVNGRVLGTTFLLKAGQRIYVTLYALDVSGNYSKVTKYVVAPGGIVAKSKHKVVKKKAGTKKPALITTKPPAKKKVVKDKPIQVQIG
jgi:hypothetical protein